MVRTRNYFPLPTRFWSAASWWDRAGAFVLLPSAWVQPGIEIGLEIKLVRFTVAWGRGRAQIDFGHYRPRPARRSLDWKGDGLDDFLIWSRQMFGGVWTREKLEELLRQDPVWYRLVALGGPPSYYTRVLLAREMLQREASRSGTATALPEDEFALPFVPPCSL